MSPAKSKIPFVPPQLATLVDAAPDGDEWVHEVKFDGYRILCRVEDGGSTLLTRTGQDWTDHFPELDAAAVRLDVGSALLDGEAAIVRPDGTTSFQALQNYLSGGSGGSLAYFAFDLLFLDGTDLRQRSLDERKQLLAEILRRKPGAVIRFSDHVVGNGPAFFHEASDAGLEGILSKRRGDPYRSGRSPSWLKTKVLKRQEFVVGGFTEPEGARTGIGALLVGSFRAEKLAYAGKVGTGFSQKIATDLRRQLDRLVVPESPFDERIAGAGRQIRWVRPQLVVEIAYSEMTDDGKLRHPSFQGVRQDKLPTEVVKEVPKHMSASGEKPATKRSVPRALEARAGRAVGAVLQRQAEPRRAPGAGASRKATLQTIANVVGGVKLTHPERLLEPDAQLTKHDLAEYYQAIAPFMLPHLIGRPLSLVRCPEGTSGKCFFMKHAAFVTPGLRRVTIKEKEEKGEYLIVETTSGLIGLAQMSVLEVHTWNAVDSTLEMPDRVVFDFDPGPDVAWKDVVRGAMLVRERVEQIGFATFVKSTGGKGLHVVVPLVPSASWDECRAFSQLVSESVVASDPKSFTTAIRKEGREKKILLDYFRNNRGSTSVAAFSTRARPGLPISVPLAWDEIASFKPEQPFTISSVLRRVARGYRDPWAKYEARRKRLKDVILDGKPKRRAATSHAARGGRSRR